MDFEVKNAPGFGLGLYANYSYAPGETILKFEGAKLLEKDIEDFSGPIASSYLQISPDTYLDLRKRNEYFINHSCNPNAYVKIVLGQAFLVALYPIKAGEQLFYDYSTTSTEDESTWIMECKCGDYSCRKKITGFSSVPDSRKIYYINNGFVPEYVKI